MFRNIILRIYCWYANYTAITLGDLDDGYNANTPYAATYHLYVNQVHSPFNMWVTIKPQLVGKFHSFNDAASYAHNCLGHATSDTFTIRTMPC